MGMIDKAIIKGESGTVNRGGKINDKGYPRGYQSEERCDDSQYIYLLGQ